MRYLTVIGVLMVIAVGASALNVGDAQPGLDGYLIDDSGDYLGEWLDIEDYLNAGKVVVVVHWKRS